MVRKTSGLFLSTAENAILGSMLYTLLAGVMDLVYPTDFSPGMRGAMLTQLVLVLVTGAAVTALCTLDGARFVLPPLSSTQEDSGGSGSSSEPLAEWVRGRRRACMNSQAVAKAYCACTLGLFVFFLSCFVQASTGWGLPAAATDGQQRMAKTVSDNASSSVVYYNSSQRMDWLHAIAGGAAGTGWTLQQQALNESGNVSTWVHATPLHLPFMGSIFSGAVLAFLAVSLLLSIYLCLTATPEGEGSLLLLLDPHSLTVANGIVAFASTQGVGQIFAFCSTDVAGGCALFFLFALVACWADEIPTAFLWLSDVCYRLRHRAQGYEKASGRLSDDHHGKGDDASHRTTATSSLSSGPWHAFAVACQVLFAGTVSFVPPFGILMTHRTDALPWAVATFSLVISGVSASVALLDGILRLMRRRGSGRSALEQGASILSHSDGEGSSKGEPVNEQQREPPLPPAAGGGSSNNNDMWRLDDNKQGGGVSADQQRQQHSSEADPGVVVESGQRFFGLRFPATAWQQQQQPRSMYSHSSSSSSWNNGAGNHHGIGHPPPPPVAPSMFSLNSSDSQGLLSVLPPGATSSAATGTGSSRERRRPSTPTLGRMGQSSGSRYQQLMGGTAVSPGPDVRGFNNSSRSGASRKWHDA